MFKVAIINAVNELDSDNKQIEKLKVTDVITVEKLESINDIRRYINCPYTMTVNDTVKTGMYYDAEKQIITDEFGEQIYPNISPDLTLYKLNEQVKELTFNKDISTMPLEDVHEYLIKKNKRNLELFLESNPMKYNDKYYTVTSDKQNQLTGLLNAYRFAKDINIDIDLTWNETGKECEPYTYEQLVQIYLAMLSYIKPLVTHQQETELRIKETNDFMQAGRIDITFDSFLVKDETESKDDDVTK